MIRIYVILLLLVMGGIVNAQTMYGTTGLLHAPTADMQRDKTFMLGQRASPHSVALFQQQ